MQTTPTSQEARRGLRGWAARGRLWAKAAAAAAALLLASEASAQVTVRTLGGGRLTASGSDSGYVDGDILQVSQFNGPLGAAVDAAGNVYVADSRNGAVRKLDLASDRSTTLISELSEPVAVVAGATNDLYVLTRGDGTILRYDRFEFLETIAAGLSSPTALAFDGAGLLYVTEESGRVLRVNVTNRASTVVATGLLRPGGIAVLQNGRLAVSETGGHRIRFIDPATGAAVGSIGTGVAGFRNGQSTVAQFREPQQIVRTPAGGLIVADRGNHRVRAVNPEGAVSTVYGVDPNFWEGPECLHCDPIILPGWYDGPVEFAEAREPAGVALAANGTIYTTEAYYHLVREISGFTGGGSGGPGGPGGTNLTLVAPLLSPDTGYFPMGQLVTVTNPNRSDFLQSRVFYTTDGSEPTTNSLELAMQDNTGVIRWTEKTRDLRSLRVRAVIGSTAGPIASGRAATQNEIGLSRDLAAGPGSTALVPVVANLRTNQSLKSLQFRIEFRPLGAAPPIPDGLQALPTSTNDWIVFATSDQDNNVSSFNAVPYSAGTTRGLLITFLGTAANMSVSDFATVALLAVPISPSARFGDRYSVEIISPSGTTDGSEEPIQLAPIPPRVLSIEQVAWMAGDSSPGRWYNADSANPSSPARLGFGDGILSNNDVNNALSASLDLRVPFLFSDAFNAMDVFPLDTPGNAGGDGLIRFLDWQIILFRSLGLDATVWERYWDEGGIRRARRPGAPVLNRHGLHSIAGQSSAPGAVWNRPVLLSAGTLDNLPSGTVARIPIYATVAEGHELGGLAFRLRIEPGPGTPPLESQIDFEPAPLVPAPQKSSIGLNEFFCAWSLVPAPSFNPPLSGKKLLGYVRFIPSPWAERPDYYTLRFSNADGAPDLETQYDFETRPARLWLDGPALQADSLLTDEWRTHFFGSVTNLASNPELDPDGDGLTNLDEYNAGTDPASAESAIRLESASVSGEGQVVLRWLSAPFKSYAIESSPSLAPPQWSLTVSNLAGNGGFVTWTAPGGESATNRFFRLLLEQP